MTEWIKIAARRDIVVRGIKVAAVVGTVLVIINQGDALIGGQITATVVWKIALTYLVPYCVSTYAGVAAILAQTR